MVLFIFGDSAVNGVQNFFKFIFENWSAWVVRFWEGGGGRVRNGGGGRGGRVTPTPETPMNPTLSSIKLYFTVNFSDTKG